MLNNNNFFLFVLIFFFFAGFGTVNSKDKYGEITSVEYPDNDDKRVYFGAFRQNDSSSMKFLLKNFNPSFPLRTSELFPTFIISNTDSSSTHNDDMLMFRYSHGTIILNENKPDENLNIKFVTFENYFKGRKEARLLIGFVSPNDTTVLLHQDTFFLIGKFTELAIDGYDDFVFFDSVFINQSQPVQKEWRVRNTTDEKLDVINQQFTLLSPDMSGNEFVIDEKNYPLTFFPASDFAINNTNFRSWHFGYSPVDTHADSAEVRLLFKPFPASSPDFIDTVKVRLYGVGVQHSLEVVDTVRCKVFFDIVNIFNKIDTIDFGEVRVGNKKTGRVDLRNTGNLEYALKNQVIYDEITDDTVDYFSIERPFCQNNNSLKIIEKDFFEIEFSPMRRGKFTARYVLENNFKDRKIKSNNPSDYKKVFILRGIGVEPALQITANTVDFGNVSYANANDCPTEKDTLITLLNVGNSELIISNIATDNNAAFRISPTTTSIKPNSETTIKLTFVSSFPERNISGNLFFTTNEIAENTDTVRLFGKSIPPIEAELSIPFLSNKPGSLLNVPIYLTSANDERGSVSDYGNSYSFYLSYNPTMLSYANYITSNTASAGCFPIVERLSDGLISVRVQKDFSSFLHNPTLLILQFRTFLGNSITTDLMIENAKIGNSICDDFMKLDIQNGRYSIDSICGLPYKLNDLSGLFYTFDLISQEINLNSIDFIFTLPFDTDAQISIYNALGGEIISEKYLQLPSGVFIKSLPFDLHSGVYYAIFSSGLFRKIIPVIQP